MQFVIGWLKLKPGKRQEFMPLAKTHEAATQKEDGWSSPGSVDTIRVRRGGCSNAENEESIST
jgi:hypothetical protein